MGKILLIDEKMNTVEIEVNQTILKNLGLNSGNVKHHKSRRQLNNEITKYLENIKNIT